MAGSLDIYLADRKALKPSSNYVWTGSLWVPQLAASDGSIAATEPAVAAATLSTVASSAASGVLIAANTARRGLILYNTDANAAYVKYGTAAASLTSFTVIIPAGGYWEMPKPVYTGGMTVIWAADGAGSMFVTEL